MGGSNLIGRVSREPPYKRAIDEARRLHLQGNGLEGDAFNIFINPKVTKITEHLYLGNQTNAQEIADQKTESSKALLGNGIHGVKAIYTCSESPTFAASCAPDVLSKKEGAHAKYPNGIVSIWDPFGDENNDLQKAKFKEVCKRAIIYFEEQKLSGTKVLVHCNAGSSRSASVAIAYKMALGQSFSDALLEVVRVRPLVNISNFQDVLLDEAFINELKGLIQRS